MCIYICSETKFKIHFICKFIAVICWQKDIEGLTNMSCIDGSISHDLVGGAWKRSCGTTGCAVLRIAACSKTTW